VNWRDLVRRDVCPNNVNTQIAHNMTSFFANTDEIHEVNIRVSRNAIKIMEVAAAKPRDRRPQHAVRGGRGAAVRRDLSYRGRSLRETGKAAADGAIMNG
jgi:hypothetical protein